MKKTWILMVAVSVGLLPVALAACMTTYTEAELRAEGADQTKVDAEARQEEKIDREIGEEGGANEQAVDEEYESINTENEL